MRNNANNADCIGISQDRLRHSIAVARKCSEIAKKEFSASKEYCEDMFVLGFVHDIGYEFSHKQTAHALCGGEVLRRNDYRYSNEVSNHGEAGHVADSREQYILDKADMMTSPKGEPISISDRLDDIATRYGKGSIQYAEAAKLATEIKEQESKITSTNNHE
mgnify:CR=1 FL=1